MGFVLGLLLGGAAAAAAFRGTPTIYRAVGLIEVRPHSSKLTYDAELRRPKPYFESFVESQAALATGRRVMDMARASPGWTAVVRTAAADARFSERAEATRRLGTCQVEVAFVDEDPAVAIAGLRAVLDAYMALVAERDDASGLGRLRVLDRQRNLLLQLAELHRGSEALTSQGLPVAADVADVVEVQTRLAEVDRRLGELKFELAMEPPILERISIADRGSRPDVPDRDRRPRNAAIAGAGGFLIGLLLGRTFHPRA